MNRLRSTAAAFVTATALGSLGLAAVPTASADAPAEVPCATQQAHVDRATAKLQALTAKFAAHPSKKNQKAKKAQVQRVARATARLEKCLAAQSA
ncbi:MAG: hypothetical protein U0R79_00995 [Propionicimonas sp.]